MQAKTLWIRHEYLQQILDGRNTRVYPKDKEAMSIAALEITRFEKND